MSLEEFLSQGLILVGTFNPKIAIFLFLICFIGDAWISVPYLLETTWLLAGYQLSNGVLSFYHLLLLILASQIGRQAGSIILFYFGRIGSIPFIKYKDRFKIGPFKDNSIAIRMFHKIDISSPFSVAFGRLIGLRIPLALILGAKRKLKIFSLGVLISGLVFDVIYIILGSIFGTVIPLKPIYMFLLFLAVLTIIYLMSFVVRYFITQFLRKRVNNKTN